MLSAELFSILTHKENRTLTLKKMSDEQSPKEEEKKNPAETPTPQEPSTTDAISQETKEEQAPGELASAIKEEAESTPAEAETSSEDELGAIGDAVVEEAASVKHAVENPSEDTESDEDTPSAVSATEDPSEDKVGKSTTEVSEENEKSAENSEKDSEDDTEEDEEEINSSDEEEEDDDDDTKNSTETDYSNLTKKELVAELKKLIDTKAAQHIKNEVEEIKTEFNSQFNEELEQKKKAFLAEGGNIIDFHYSTPLKKEFNSLYFDYKEKRNNYYKNLKKDLQANLAKRQELIEELKGLLNAEENINTTYKHFKDIQTRWQEAGPIPRDKYNLVWNTYHHHVENFYDFLHLNREFRDLDFKHNLEQKLKLIVRAEELAQEENLNKAFRELQMLHKMWKEEIGPVAKEYRDKVWDQFSAATKVIHDKRQDYLSALEKNFETNYEEKMKLVDQINDVSNNTKPSHQAWQQAIKKVQALRDTYFELGKVPKSKNKEIWNAFKEATRNFNKAKNNFYKQQKKEQYANLEKKKELIKIAEDNKENDDFETVAQLMKKIQSDWKKIGHVPRKDSDKIWKQFKGACNFFFDRLHAQKNEASKEELVHYETKKEMLESLKNMELTGDHKADLAAIKEKIKVWKNIGKVPYNKRSIDQDFNKVLDGLFGKLDLGKKETELIKFDNKLNSLANQEDERKLRNEHFFISKKIEETKDEIRQLENNLGFFQNVDSNNPLVKEVHNNIARQKEQLEVWKAKLDKIKSVRES